MFVMGGIRIGFPFASDRTLRYSSSMQGTKKPDLESFKIPQNVLTRSASFHA